MNDTIIGKVAIVTGAGSGIGFEIAHQLVEKGVKVILNDIDEGLAVSSALQIGEENCLAFPGDAGKPDFIASMVEAAVENFGSLDICIANAGITSYGEFLKTTPEQFDQLLNLNLRGTYFLAQAGARQMIEQASGGKILLMSSVTGILAHNYLAAYSMTKAAITMLGKSLVIELSPYNISVNVIAPGAVSTERTLAKDPNYAQKYAQYIPTSRVATPHDIASTTLFLLSPAARQINGQTIVVDGGITSLCAVPKDLEEPD